MVIFAEAIGLFLFAFIRNPWIMLFVITIPFGFVNGGANIPSFTLRQEKIPHKKLGRATSFSIMFCSLFNLLGTTIVMLIANRIAASYIVMIGGIICSILFIVSFTTFLTKSKLRCSDYQKDEVKLKKEIVKDLEVLINYDDTETTSSTVMATSRSPTLE
ncbi:MAG: MFS transporter, partial [Candidatus Heimdallarchaeota archaeon]